MTTTKAISANPQKNDSGTILQAGNISSSRWNDLSLAENNSPQKPNSYKVLQAGGTAGQSGNLGTFKPVTGEFGHQQTPENFAAPFLLDSIAGTATTTVLQNSSNTDAIPSRWQGYQRYGISSVNAYTGAVSYSANRGVTVRPSGIDGVVGADADNVFGVPAELTFMDGSPNPVNTEYKTILQS